MAKCSVRDLSLRGQRVLIRADFNVPLDSSRAITDDRRIRQFLPTLDFVAKAGGRAILISHLGRPVGDPQKDQGFSLRPVAQRLHELTGRPCGFVADCAAPAALAATNGLAPGETLLLENLRFHVAETLIDDAKKYPDKKLPAPLDEQRKAFARNLAALADVYVNDAFGTCHRKHVSMYDVPALLGPGKRAIGFLVEKELEYLGRALDAPQRPFVAVLGGAKVSDKIGVINKLLEKVDAILIGGAMTYTFWAAQGRAVGKSLCERDKLDLARELLAKAAAKMKLPVDSVAAEALRAGVATRIIEGPLPDDLMGLDIGPRTIREFGDVLARAKTIVWNGPVGAFETPPFDQGTLELARTIAAATDAGAISVIGGGDSAAAVEQAGLAERITHISTGGGASLNFLEGKRFDPIEVIDDV